MIYAALALAALSPATEVVIDDMQYRLDDPYSVRDLHVCDPDPARPGKSQRFLVMFRANGRQGGLRWFVFNYRIKDGEVRSAHEVGDVTQGNAPELGEILNRSTIRHIRNNCTRISDDALRAAS